MTAPMTPERLEVIKALFARYERTPGEDHPIANILPELIAEAERLRAELNEVIADNERLWSYV